MRTAGRPAARPGVVRQGSSSLVAQAVSSGGNVAIGLAAVRLLTPADYGRFSVLFAAMLVAVAVQTSWVGDSLTVLDRRRDAVWRGISTWQLVLAGTGAVAAFAFAVLVVQADLAVASAFACLTAAWQFEELGRRLFLARMEFRRLGVNDGVYVGTAATVLLVLHVAGATSLGSILVAMAVGAAVAFAAAMATLPSEDRLRLRRLGGPGVGEVGRFGFWRGSQGAVGSLSGATVRVIVLALGSAAVVGDLEAARLVVAPLFVLAGAVANFLLPYMTGLRLRHEETTRTIRRLTWLLGGISLLYGVVVLLLAEELVHLIAGEEYASDPAMVAGWLALALLAAATNPALAAAVVHCRPSSLFVVKLVQSVAATGLAALAAATGRVSLVPAAIAVVAAVAGAVTWRMASTGLARTERTRRRAATAAATPGGVPVEAASGDAAGREG